MTALPMPSHHEPTPRRDRPAAARRGFTLVELMVVLIIVGMLVGLVTPAVMQALRKSRNAAIKAEIDMLHMAIMNYKNEYGSFPPCFLGLENSTADTNRVAVRNHLRRIFPRANFAVQPEPGWQTSQMLFVPLTNDPSASIVFWLRGFFDNPLFPLSGVESNLVTGVAPSPRKQLFEFDRLRLEPTTVNPLTHNATSPPIQSYRGQGLTMPYVYFDAARYGPPLTPSFHQAPSQQAHVQPYFHDLNADGTADIVNEGYCNPQTFQILCAGRDNRFAPWAAPNQYPYSAPWQNPLLNTSGQGPIALYPAGLTGADQDNVTNFASGVLEDQKP
jgi:type II secretion system protein G